MGLPKIDVPTQNINLPSTKKELLIRPFLVKEEKILLTALASEDSVEVVNATRQVVNNCVLTKDFDIDSIAIYDLEFLLLKLRVMSVGEKLKLRFQALENSTCEECKKPRELEVDISQASVIFPEGHEKKVELTNNVGIVLKDPEARIMQELDKAKYSKDITDLLKIIWKCVDFVYEGDNITASKDVSLEEGVKFLESLKSNQFKKVEQFFNTIPKLHLSVPVKCSKCEYSETYVMEKLEDFFA